MFDLIGYALPTEPEDVRTADDLDAELAALLADPRSRWAPGELEAMFADAAAHPAIQEEAVWSSESTSLLAQLNRTRCLLAAARTDRDAACQERDTTARERDAVRADHAMSAAALDRALLEGQATAAALNEARADLALARIDAAHPGTCQAEDLAPRLHDGPPGPALAAAIAAAVGDLSGDTPGTPGVLGPLPDTSVVEVAAACGRLVAWAMAAQMAAVAEFADRIARTPLAGDDQGYSVTVAEMALACGVSRYAMGEVLTTAQLLPQRFPRLYRMLVEGHLEWTKARLVVDKTLCQPDTVITAVEDGVTPVITQATKPELAALIDRLIAKADPRTHEEQAAEARQDRRVTFRSAGNGMGTMSLVAGAEDIEAVRTALNEATFAARRAQPDLPRTARPSDPDDVGAPLDPDGRHPVATRADTLIDLILGTPKTADDAAQRPAPTRARADVTILIPLSVLLGHSDTPPDLAGYGPIPAQLARELAATGTWRCAAVDDRPGSPTHDTILGLGRTTYTPAYQPGPAARRFVHQRDRTCRFPGCRQPATRCDLDHRTPWHDNDEGGGATCDCNLHALCRHHHRLKQNGFTPTPTTAGTKWTTPTGRTYLKPPDTLPS